MKLASKDIFACCRQQKIYKMLHQQAVREPDQTLTLVLQRFGMFGIFQVHGVCLTCKESSALNNQLVAHSGDNELRPNKDSTATKKSRPQSCLDWGDTFETLTERSPKVKVCRLLGNVTSAKL